MWLLGTRLSAQAPKPIPLFSSLATRLCYEKPEYLLCTAQLKQVSRAVYFVTVVTTFSNLGWLHEGRTMAGLHELQWDDKGEFVNVAELLGRSVMPSFAGSDLCVCTHVLFPVSKIMLPKQRDTNKNKTESFLLPLEIRWMLLEGMAGGTEASPCSQPPLLHQPY